MKHNTTYFILQNNKESKFFFMIMVKNINTSTSTLFQIYNFILIIQIILFD